MQTEMDITQRFLGAYADLLEVGKTNSHRFCADVGADRRNLAKLLKNPARHLLRPGWLAGMVDAYGVSAHWLLTGRGSMFGL